MTKRIHTSMYFAEDKDIFDLFHFSKRVFDTKKLLALGRERGIVLSANTSRDLLVDYLSRLTWSWPQIQRLIALTNSSERKEKVASEAIVTNLDEKTVADAVVAVRETRGQRADEVHAVTVAANGTIVVKVTYSEFEPSRTRLCQKVQRELLMEIEKGSTGYVFRYNANERGKQIVSDIISRLPKDSGTPVEQKQISLSGVTDPAKRTEYFLYLMQNISGYKLENVTSVSVDFIPEEANTPDTLTSPSGDSFASPEGGAEPEETAMPENVEESEQMLSVVRRVALDGDSLLGSKQFTQLREQRFYISRATWRSKEDKAKGVALDFEADFEDPKACSGFRYNVLGVYNQRAKGEAAIKKTRSPIPGDLRASALRLLEDAAQSAFESVVSSIPPASSKAPVVPKSAKKKRTPSKSRKRNA